MIMRRTLPNLRNFVVNRSGVAAVEFALVAPVLILLYAGCVDVTRAVTFHRKLMHTTAAIGDLVAQSTDLTQADVVDIFDVADAMMAGYPKERFTVKVSGVTVDDIGRAKVEWSVAQGVTADKKNALFTLPESLRALRSQSFIMTDATDSYVPLMRVLPDLTITMTASSRNRSRGRVAVSCTDCS